MSIISETMKKWADENEIALDEVQLESCLLYTSDAADE